jgi:transposase, IS6 family
MIFSWGTGPLTSKTVKNATRPAVFKWRQTTPELILCAVRWYLRYSLSLRDVEELFAERSLEADHATIWRWVQSYGPELEQRLRGHLKPTNKSWRVDETYIRVKGRWCYLYRAIDSTGATIDFLLSPLRDAAAAKRLFRKALSDPSHLNPASSTPIRLASTSRRLRQ